MIDPSLIERELNRVLAQAQEAREMLQKAHNVTQQAIGAEKAFNAVLHLMKEAEANAAAAKKAQQQAAAASRRLARQRKAKGDQK
ncbi:hypothetical protein ACHMW7_16205 [Aminobacter sp. UC22_36]|uniref:hypothetical protein n=1 Tax=Aminobacter sp. UC22_36 TaxID=3374549 RepID=UPI00375821BC